MRPVDSDVYREIEERLPELMRELLTSCGEEKCYLGRADAIVFNPKESGERAERLRDVWVIDREWSDGRWATEWLYVSMQGQRLRVAGGGLAMGEIHRGRRLDAGWLIWAFNVAVVCFCSYYGVCIAWVWAPIALTFACYAPIWFPVHLRASLWQLNSHCIPGAELAYKAQLPSDQAALQSRITAVINAIELKEL